MLASPTSSIPVSAVYLNPTSYPSVSFSSSEYYLTILGHLALLVKEMAAILDSSPPSPSPEQKHISTYRDAQPPPSWRRPPANPGKTRRSVRFSTQSAQRDWRASILSRSSSVYRPHRDSDVRDWEAELAVFRMSWYDEFDLFDAYSWGQIEDGNEAQDENVVDWDGPDDPANPLNWSAGRKWANIITFSTITMIRQPHPSSHSAQTHSIYC